MELSFPLLAAIGALLLGLAAVAPTHVVLLSEFPLGALQGYWEVAGVLLDPTDPVLAAVIFSLIFRKWPAASTTWPLRTWLLLGVLISVAFALAPMNQPNLTDPFRIAYQLYRYAWRLIIYFPLAFLLLGGKKRVRLAITSLIVGADLCSVPAILQGLAGSQATGPFTHWNHLGGALLGPLLFCVGRVFFPRSRWDLVFSAGSSLLIARALLYAASRGAIVSFLVGSAFLVGWMSLASETRRRLLRLTPLAILGLVLLMIVVPDLTQRPNIQRALTIRNPTEVGTFQWRVNERWPHFWKMIVDNPWFGVGRDYDFSLGPAANTPHNGYMSLALKFGIPVALLYLGFGLRAIQRGVAVFRSRNEAWLRVTGLSVSSVLFALLTHNLVDSMFTSSFVGNEFWMLCGLAFLLYRWPEESSAAGSSRPLQLGRG